MTVPSCAKNSKDFFSPPSPGGRERVTHVFGSLEFTSPPSPAFFVALAESFCLLHKNYTMHGTNKGWVRKIIPIFAQGMPPHQGEAKIIAGHQMIHRSWDRPPHRGRGGLCGRSRADVSAPVITEPNCSPEACPDTHAVLQGHGGKSVLWGTAEEFGVVLLLQ